MDSETGWIRERIKLYELMQTHPEWSLRHYASELGHDVKWVHKWKKRIQKATAITIETFKSQSCAPRTPPRPVSADVKALVVELRHTLSLQYHRRAGAKTILYGFQQLQASQSFPFALPRAASTITKILHEMGCIPLVKPALPNPVILPPPMEEWEIDFGEIGLAEGRVFEFFVVVDRGTSLLVYLEGAEGHNAETALEAVARLLRVKGLPKRLRFDRDPRLVGAWSRDSYPSPLVRFLRVLGVEPIVCPPHRPDLKPFVERCIGTLKHEWFARHAPSTLAEAFEVLDSFPKYYNQRRPHQGRACQNRPPAVAFPLLPVLPALPDVVDPDAWLQAVHTRVYRRHVSSSGTIQIDRHLYNQWCKS